MIRNYIERKLIKREDHLRLGDYAPFFKGGDYDLYTQITTCKSRRVCILGDAGCGKTTELKNLTLRLLEDENEDFVPIYVDLSTYVDEDIENYMIVKIGEDSKELLSLKHSGLVFLIDEFDQVLNKGVAKRKIKNFIEKYEDSAFIIACRSNIYSYQFEEFSVFYISPFNFDDVKTLSELELSSESVLFLDRLREKRLIEHSQNPFFTSLLVEIFKKDKDFSSSLKDIFCRIIDVSLESDQVRLADKYDLRQKYTVSEILHDLKVMSLIMETLQRNYLTLSEFNQVVNNSFKRDVITELSIIRKSISEDSDIIQFQHNNFQEFLAASLLNSKSFENILEFITPKSHLPEEVNHDGAYRVIPSWSNTVAFLCNLRTDNGDLLEYLMKYDSELSLKFEADRLRVNIRIALFKSVFEKYTLKRIWIDRNVIDYDQMASFGNHQEIHSYLMGFAKSDVHFVYRYNAIQMLSHMTLGSANEEFMNLLIALANNDEENQNVRHECFYALASIGAYTKDVINKLKHLKDSKDEWVLAGLYHLISKSDSVSEYLDILISGFDIVGIKINSSKSQLAGVGINLKNAIDNILEPEGIRKLLSFFSKTTISGRLYYFDDVLKRIFKNAVLAFSEDETIYNDVKLLVQSTSKGYSSKFVDLAKAFFVETNTADRLFDELYTEGIEQNMHFLASVANEKNVSFIADEYNDNKIDENTMYFFRNTLAYRNQESYDIFLKIIIDKTGSFLPPPPIDYEEVKRKELERKVELIFSKNDLLKEIRILFEFVGKEYLDCETVKNLLHNDDKGKKFQGFPVWLLYKSFVNKEEKYNYEDVKQFLDKMDYGTFTIQNIFDVLYNGSDIQLNEDQVAFIYSYCIDHIEGIDFRTALSRKVNGASTNSRAMWFWYFIRKYNINVGEAVFLDMVSFDWIEGHSFVGIEYLEKRIEFYSMKNRILKNLDEGLTIDCVLMNHIKYCRKHSVSESTETLKRYIIDESWDMELRIEALETIASFPGTESYVIEVMNMGDLDLFIKASEILMERENETCVEVLKKTLESNIEEFAYQAALKLLKLQNIDAIKYYFDHIKKNKSFHVDFHGECPINDINSIEALPLLIDLLDFSFKYKDEINQEHDIYRLDYFISGVLRRIAITSYPLFIRVINELRKFINENINNYENVGFLNIQCDDIEKTFLGNYSNKLTLEEVIDKVNAI